MSFPTNITVLIVVLVLCQLSPSLATIDLDRQVQKLFQQLKGKRVGVLTNPTGVDSQLRMLIDTMFTDKDMNLVCFFAPEHGLRGDQQDGATVVDYIDPITNLPVYSVYGTRIAPTDQQLSTIDVLVYYIQDVGTRYYTFIWSMTYAMDACAKNNKQFIVFDRPNPINGIEVGGCPITFNGGLVGRKYPKAPYGVPQQYGMTIGELATLVNEEWADQPVNLQVIKMINYNRSQFFEDSGQTWIVPSPNIPTVDTAVVYAGMGLVESTNVAEGRGTTKPFEMIGAPFIDAYALSKNLNALQLPGVLFHPIYFIPTFNKYQGQVCGGVGINVLDRTKYHAVRTGVFVVQTIYNMYPTQLTFDSGADEMFGLPNFVELIKTTPADQILSSCQYNYQQFQNLRRQYLFYSGKDANVNFNIQLTQTKLI